jgi:hypothetical protein
MRERAPGLPEVNAAEMAALRTLGQIVDYMRERVALVARVFALGFARGSDRDAARVRGPLSGPELEALMLSIVAEKTGYPVEMLGVADGARGRPRASTRSSASRSSRRCASAPRACPR